MFTKTDPAANPIIDALGMGLNFLEDSGLKFDLEYNKLTKKQQEAFRGYKDAVISGIASSPAIDRQRKYDSPDEFTLLRFLQADNYVIHKAVSRILSTIAWRQSSGIIEMVTSPTGPPGYDTYLQIRKRRIIGRDLQHRPIVYESIGDLLGHPSLPGGLSEESWLNCYAYETAQFYTELRSSSIANGEVIQRFTFIANLEGTHPSHVRKLKLIKTMKEQVEIHFPECAGTIYLINAPRFLSLAWHVVQKMLDANVAKKIQIHSGIPTALLIKDLGVAAVPVAFGGKNDISL